MKLKTALSAVLATGMPMVCSAFSLDAVGYDGTGLSPTPFTVGIPGYGEVLLEGANAGTEIVLISTYSNRDGIGGSSVKFDPRKAVEIEFREVEPLAPDLRFEPRRNTREWVAIPETTSAFLGLIGMGLILLRRRN